MRTETRSRGAQVVATALRVATESLHTEPAQHAGIEEGGFPGALVAMLTTGAPPPRVSVDASVSDP